MKWTQMNGWKKAEYEGYIIQLKHSPNKNIINQWDWDISYDVGHRMGFNNLAIASGSRTQKQAKKDILAWFKSKHRAEIEKDKPEWIRLHKEMNELLDEMKTKNIRVKLI